MPLRPRRAIVLALSIYALAVAGCGTTPAPSGAATAPPSAASAPPSAATAPSSAANDLAAISCSTDHPEDVGALTGAWQVNDGGVYFIRQVGDCVWWFGTNLADIDPGDMGQSGFANVAAGRMDGSEMELEWADLTLGNVVGGGGLTISVDEGGDRLRVTEQRGAWGFGGQTFNRINSSTTP